MIDKLVLELNDEFLNGTKISLYDMYGRSLLTEKIIGKKHTISMQNFASGNYILKVSNDSQSIYAHVIK